MNKKVFVVGALLMFSGAAMAQEQSTQNIQEVTLASKMPQDITKTGKNITLLTAKDLEKFKGQNLTDVLDQVVGFQISGNFNNTAEPKSLKVRGGTDKNVVILVDGVPMRNVTGVDFTVDDLRLFALENVESIEVLNGSSSVLYGSNATVSVINIHTKKGGSKAIEGNASVRGGSFDTFAQNASVRGRAGKINYGVNGFNEKSTGISAASGDSSFDKDGWEKQNVDATVGYSDEKFNINVNGGWMHNLYKYDDDAFVDGLWRGNDKQYFGGLNAGYKYKNGKLTLTSRYSNIDRVGQNYVNRAYQDQYGYKGENVITELFNNYTVNQNFSFTVGAQHEYQDMSSTTLPYGENAMVDVHNKNQTKVNSVDAYANFNANYNGFNIDAGARMTNNSKYNTHWVYSVNPYYLGEINSDYYYKVGYSFATAFIAPTLYQNYGFPFYNISGNPDLKPETNQSHEVDLAFGKKDRSLNITASLYYRKEKDVIYFATGSPSKYMNGGENQVRGADVGFDYKIIDRVRFGANYSYVHKDNEATRYRQPKTRVNSFIEVKPFLSTSVVLSHQYVSKRDDAYYDSASFGTKYVVDDSFNLFAVNINQKITKDLSAFFNVGNVFNTSYVDIVGYTTKKRNYTLGFSYNF